MRASILSFAISVVGLAGVSHAHVTHNAALQTGIANTLTIDLGMTTSTSPMNFESFNVGSLVDVVIIEANPFDATQPGNSLDIISKDLHISVSPDLMIYESARTSKDLLGLNSPE